MSTRTWIGGGNNSVYNANDWSPAGAPQPGDVLFMMNGTANMAGGDLAGDTLHLSWNGTWPPPPMAPVLNMSHGATLNASLDSYFAPNNSTINVFEHDTLDVTAQGLAASSEGTNLSINLEPGSNLAATINLLGAAVSVSGSGNLQNQASSIEFGYLNITSDMTGTGMTRMQFQSNVDIGGSVTGGQNFLFDMSGYSPGYGTLTIDNLGAFHGLVASGTEAMSPGPDYVSLLGIHADSYELSSSMLKLFDQNNVVGKLRLNDQATQTFVGQGASGVLVGFNVTSAPSGYTPLPMHS